MPSLRPGMWPGIAWEQRAAARNRSARMALAFSSTMPTKAMRQTLTLMFEPARCLQGTSELRTTWRSRARDGPQPMARPWRQRCAPFRRLAQNSWFRTSQALRRLVSGCPATSMRTRLHVADRHMCYCVRAASRVQSRLAQVSPCHEIASCWTQAGRASQIAEAHLQVALAAGLRRGAQGCAVC